MTYDQFGNEINENDMNENIPESPEKGKQFLTEDDLDALVEQYSFQVPYDVTNKFYNEEKAKHFSDGFNAAAEKANKRIAELETECGELLNRQGIAFQNKIKELEKERDTEMVSFLLWTMHRKLDDLPEESIKQVNKLLKQFKSTPANETRT